MRHNDPELLAMMAMGDDDVPVSASEHLADCAECRAELASLRRVADLGRSGGPDDSLGAPRPIVWTRIRSELGLAADAVAPVTSDDATEAAARTLPHHREYARRHLWIAVAAAAAAVAAIAGGLAVTQPGSRQETLATARLDAFPDWEGASGEASVATAPDGSRDISVRVDATTAADGEYREVWLLTDDSTGLISLGVLDGDTGRFTVPDGVELTEFPVIDVSQERLDGDPAHSGDSIVRGSLEL